MSFAKVALVTALFGISSLLQGCSCDRDRARICSEDLAANPKRVTCATFSGCFKDAKCCETSRRSKRVLAEFCAKAALTGDTSKDACA